MSIGSRIRQLREEKGLSQGDLENSSGLLRCYISRVENGHTVPSLDTLEKFAAALDVPLYRMFYSDGTLPPTPNLTPRKTLEELANEETREGQDARFLLKMKGLLSEIDEPGRDIILTLARKLATR